VPQDPALLSRRRQGCHPRHPDGCDGDLSAAAEGSGTGPGGSAAGGRHHRQRGNRHLRVPHAGRRSSGRRVREPADVPHHRSDASGQSGCAPEDDGGSDGGGLYEGRIPCRASGGYRQGAAGLP